jgi:hypothetical protein
MRLPEEENYGYNRYLDSLHLKASEAFTLKTEAEFKIREEERNEINTIKELVEIIVTKYKAII